MPSAGSQSIVPSQQPQPPHSQLTPQVQTIQLSSYWSAASSSSSSPRQQAQLDVPYSHNSTRPSSTESILVPSNGRRAYSDITDLFSTTTKRSREDTNAGLASSSTTSTSTASSTTSTLPSDASFEQPVTKRVASRHSVPSREGKRVCTICKKSFKKLNDHLWTHSPEPRPHKCRAGYTNGKPTCQYVTMGFARVADRNRHELKHYDGRFVCPFGIENCRIGNERFGRLDTFKRHLRTVHGQSPAARDGNSSSPGTVSPGQPSSAPAGQGRPRRRHRTRRFSTSDEVLECYNCNKTYYDVEAFIGHLNDCTYALMHPGETDEPGVADESADLGNDDSD
ncbi:hypothetical protein V1517DRAFT_251875 [Lipomyces orientalis]|uniref:Uncharacterized protein n=1 Tax=Lipomyces orientalis TaxID=1233043 RepID=A0ACC3TZD4_9ASCO